MAISKWWKVDFHTHSPASKCFKNHKAINENIDGQEDFAEEWIKKAMDKELDAVVVCDHNSLEWIQLLRKANEKLGKKVVIFPGIEMCLTINKMHIIIVFDPFVTDDMLRTFIEQCRIPRNSWGDTNKYISEEDLINSIDYFEKEYKEKIIVIPAHYDKAKGMGKLLTDETIKEFIKKISIDAIEIRDEEGDDLVKQKIDRNVLPHVATIVGSDNPGDREGEHTIAGLGKKYTWVKMSEPSLEALRQAFLDPESRIIKVVEVLKQIENPNSINHNYLGGIKISNLKHVEDIDFRFSPNLNCIVGPRGSGKSTIIESLRLALKGIDVKNATLINKTYKESSNIDLYYNFGVLKPYKITVNGKKTSPKWTIIDSSEKPIENPPEFNATIFGQKEIFNLVENEEDIEKNDSSPLLKIIDNNIIGDKIDIQENIQFRKNEIINLAQKLETSRKKLKEIPKIKAEVENSTHKLEKFRMSGILEKKEKMDKLNGCSKEIRKHIVDIKNNQDALTRELNNKIQEFKSKEDTIIMEDGKYLYRDINKEIEQLKESLEKFKDICGNHFSNIDKIIESSQLNKTIKEVEYEYSKILEENQEIEIEKYKEIVDINSKNVEKLRKLQDEGLKKDKIKEEINDKISQYLHESTNLTSKRKEVLEDINLSAENIRLTIHTLSHGNRWLQNIRRDMGRKDSFDLQFKTIYNELFSNEVLNIEKYKQWLKFILTTETGDINELIEEVEFDAKFKNIWTSKFKDNTLSSLFNIELEDRVEIKIINGTQEIGINEGSPGQRSAAILAFILNQGNQPLIIDQPEDDLDNSLIIKLVVDNIRKQKEKRQIIIVTHNPNIPVLGDAEGIIMLDRDNQGMVSLKFGKKAGCIEEKTIKKGICEIMEGGLEAFKKREKKYRYMKI